jgi:hypothetical protein
LKKESYSFAEKTARTNIFYTQKPLYKIDDEKDTCSFSALRCHGKTDPRNDNEESGREKRLQEEWKRTSLENQKEANG